MLSPLVHSCENFPVRSYFSSPETEREAFGCLIHAYSEQYYSSGRGRLWNVNGGCFIPIFSSARMIPLN